jgi:ATP-dependent helicase/nuclease subunit B
LRIGRVAADFLLSAANGRRVILSRAARRGGTPMVPARWLTRLDTFLGGQGLAVQADASLAWARALDQPEGAPKPCGRPQPSPPPAARPREITVSDVERLIADPYAFYAKHVLRLAPLDPLEQEPDAADYGTLVHEAMHAWLKALAGGWPGHDKARDAWAAATGVAFAKVQPRAAVAALWRRRLARIGEFAAAQEETARGTYRETLSERSGRLVLNGPRGEVVLKARADRLDRAGEDGLRIVDYKTGTVPSQKSVQAGTHPQLPLEALIAAEAGFDGLPALRATALEYWRLTGGSEAGAAKPLDLDLPVEIAKAREAIGRLAEGFLLGEAPFTAQPHPARRASPDYRHLARIDEWSAGEDGE